MKGIYFNTRMNKWYAQYWNKDLKKTFFIGTYNTKEEAISSRQEYLSKIYDGELIETERILKLPKGIKITRNGKYSPSIQISKSGRIKNIHTTIYLEVCDTVEEAVERRKQFILKLL